MLSQIILWVVCISFVAITVDVTRLGVTLIWGGFSPLISADTSTAVFCPSVLFLYLIIKFKKIQLSFRIFIFAMCVSTIHLSLSDPWGTMRCLVIFFKVDRELFRSLWYWGYPIFFPCFYGLLGDLLELLEVPLAFQLSHLARKSSLDLKF